MSIPTTQRSLAAAAAALLLRRGSQYQQCILSPFTQQHLRLVHNSSGSASTSSSGATNDDDDDAVLQKPFAARLASRAVIVMEGGESLAFLQGMVSNDVRPLAAPGAGPVYAAVTSPKGKLLHDMFIYRGDRDGGSGSSGNDAGPSGSSANQQQQPSPPQRLWLDVDAEGAQAALNWLARYKLRRAIALEHAGGDLAVWARYPAGAARGGPSNSGSGWFVDPRLPLLGERGVFGGSPPSSSSSSCSSSDAPEAEAEAQRRHRRLRYRLGVAEGGAELLSGQLAPADANLDALAGVSYAKGCYIGQERSSFTHFRGIVRRRVMPVATSVGGCAPGADIVSSDGSGGVVGTLLAREGPVGLAYLRLGPALAAAAAAVAADGAAPRLHVAGDAAATVVPSRPGWWPAEWGHEEDGAAAAAAAAASGKT